VDNPETLISPVEAGSVIEFSLHPANALPPIPFSFDDSFNPIVFTPKQRSPIVSIDCGKVIISNERQLAKACQPISLNLDPLCRAIVVI
jgi:hypothetical protein